MGASGEAVGGCKGGLLAGSDKGRRCLLQTSARCVRGVCEASARLEVQVARTSHCACEASIRRGVRGRGTVRARCDLWVRCTCERCTCEL